jgi:hypothetical protein
MMRKKRIVAYYVVDRSAGWPLVQGYRELGRGCRPGRLVKDWTLRNNTRRVTILVGVAYG